MSHLKPPKILLYLILGQCRGQPLTQLWTSGLAGTRSRYCVFKPQAGVDLSLTSSVLLDSDTVALPLPKLGEFSIAQQEEGYSCEMDQSIFFVSLRCAFVIVTHFITTRGASLSRHGESFCAVVCHLSVLSFVIQVVYHNLVDVRGALSLWNTRRSDCGARVWKAGCFHQLHTETFSSVQGFTIIRMFSGFPVSPQEILRHSVFFFPPDNLWSQSQAPILEEIYQHVSWAEMKRVHPGFEMLPFEIGLAWYWLKWYGNLRSLPF